MTLVVSTLPASRFEHYNVNFPENWKVKFLDILNDDEIFISTLKEADFLMISSIHYLNKTVLDKATSLKMIQVDGVGFDRVDINTAKKLNLPVCNNKGVNAADVAELTIGFMIAALRRVTFVDNMIKKNQYMLSVKEYMAQGVDAIRARSIGLIGLGDIGRKVAALLVPFNCRVFYYDPRRLDMETEKKLGVEYLNFNDLIKNCNIISLHLPLTPETTHMFNKTTFELMNPNTFLINTARGEILDQKALAEALEKNIIAGAAIDTISPEPPPSEHPLFNLSDEANKRLTITPHVAGVTNQSIKDMLLLSIENIKRALNGDTPHNIVNGVANIRK